MQINRWQLFENQLTVCFCHVLKFVLKDMRVDEQHYGGQESIKKGSEEMKLLIEDYANRILEFLDNLNKKMFNIKYPPK